MKETTIRLRKEQIEVLKAFSNINNKIFLKADRFEIIDGNNDSSAARKEGTCSALFKLNQAFSFIDDLGILDLKEFLNIIETCGENHYIEVYSGYLIISDENRKLAFKYNLSADEIENIPKTDRIEEKHSNGLKSPRFNRTIFDLSWDKIQNLFKIQSVLKASDLFFFTNNDKLAIKITSSGKFTDDGKTSTVINIDDEDIVEHNIDGLKQSYKAFNWFTKTHDNVFVKDDYTFTIIGANENVDPATNLPAVLAMYMVGKNTKIQYMLTTKMIKSY